MFMKQGRKNGFKHSEETKKKIGISTSKALKGLKKSIKHRIKIALAQKGSKSHRWRGGKTREGIIIRCSVEYKLWRESVFKRDGWKCIWCGSKKNIEADHIKPFCDYPELRFAIDNGRTLCRECHQTTDTYAKSFIIKK